MKLQRTTLFLLFTAIVLGGVVYLAETQEAKQREVAKITKLPIFGFKEDQIQALTIYQNEETLEFERATGKDTGWRLKTPKDAAASNAAVAFLLNLLVEGKSDRSFLIKPKQLPDYGLDKPLAVISVKLKNQQSHQLILGKPDFNRGSLYAQVDPSVNLPQSWNVLLVPIDFEYAVNRPLSEWQSKSESDIPKPSPISPSPTSTPSLSPAAENSQPFPSASPKPSPSATPKPSPSATPKPSPSVTPKPSPSVTPKPSPSASPKPSPSVSPKPSSTPASPKPSPSASPTPSPASGR
jgi:cell division septation protein DedD